MTTNTNTNQRGRFPRWLMLVLSLLGIAVLVVGYLVACGPKGPSGADCVSIAQQKVTEYLLSQGWKAEEITTDLTVQDSDAIFTAGNEAFSANPVFTTEELNAFLKSEDARAQLASQIVRDAISDKEVTWVGIKFLVPIQIEGNLGTDGQTVTSGATTQSGAGDVIFYAVNLDGCTVIEGIAIRAACGNPITKVTPPCRDCEPPCVYDCPKIEADDPANPGGVIPQGPGAEEPVAPLPPAIPLDPTTPVTADPSPEASPPGEPSVDPNAPTPADPAPAPIVDPDAG